MGGMDTPERRGCSPPSPVTFLRVAQGRQTPPYRPLAHTRSLRDKAGYRAANGCAQACGSTVVCLPPAGRIFNTRCGFTTDPPPEGPDSSHDLASGRRHSIGIHSIGIHSNGMDTIPMECIRNGWNGLVWNGLVGNALQCIPYQWIAIDC